MGVKCNYLGENVFGNYRAPYKVQRSTGNNSMEHCVKGHEQKIQNYPK